MQVSTLRPGLLVSLRTSMSGNVQYSANTIEADHIDPVLGIRRAKWETERTVSDPEEHERAKKARGKARTLLTTVCAASAFGLLCPEADREKLDNAIAEAREVVNAFNATASLTRVTVNILVGRVAADDVEAVRAINAEITELMDRMERGVRNTDVKTIRDAADSARAMATMLSPEASARAVAAVEAARSAARAIVRAGESAAVEVDKVALETIRTSRMAFLDTDSPIEPVQAPVTQGRAIDLDMDAATVATPRTPAPALFDMDIPERFAQPEPEMSEERWAEIEDETASEAARVAREYAEAEEESN